MKPLLLHIGNKRYSSWSLRPWLVLRKAGLAFEEIMIPLDTEMTRTQINDVSVGGTVPALHTQKAQIWDSLAICEWVAEQVPEVWPADETARARARSALAYMHASFFALRNTCPMDLCREPEAIKLDDATRNDIATMQAMWQQVQCGDGPYLFGRWSIADAFFTPVAARFHSYDIQLHPAAQNYCDTLLADSDFLAWKADAARETFRYSFDS